MNFAEVVNEVRLILKRPELDNQIKRQVNAAISLFCYDTDFARDFVEESVSIDGAEYSQAFAISSFTRFRKFVYLKRGGTNKYLRRLSINEMAKGCADRGDKFYEVGTNVNIYLKQYADTLDVGYMSYPPLLTGASGANTFWLIEMAPYMVIDKAAALLFQQIGDEVSMRTHNTQAIETYATFRKDNILSAVYP